MGGHEDVVVRIRMYRQGLGDCHLVTVIDGGAPVFRMLIDCGVYQTAGGGADTMRRIVQNVIDETGGHVDVLAVTHEHWDHVSGFNQAKALFAAHDEADKTGKLSVGAVWMGWTEDPADTTARRIVANRGAMVKRVALALNAASGFAAAGSEAAGQLASGLESVLGFFGGARRTTADAIDFARSLVATPRYCRPSDEPIALTPGIRAYVLGPPLDPARLYQLADDDQTYGMGASSAQLALLDALGGTDPTQCDRSQPFEEGFRIGAPYFRLPSSGEATPPATGDFFKDAYWGPAADGGDQSWRRIDGDWLTGSREFALKLDNATNNTSLVLALEFERSGRTLLFAADAQVGSWLSWQELAWTVDGEEVTARHLLASTAFLKVGHHGSHNATLREKGLETMSDDLVAFIPTDEVLAQKVGWGRMPLPSLVKALDRHTGGRVLRADRPFDPVMNGGAAVARFARELTQTELYYEIDIRP
ncbi:MULTISPECIES: hypothetical protein [unclassified Sphingomonas]|jgi:hypothetical protein|uniref:hypothetical protein n=1 Tax=unclassified Sphingomonas TaxID=196159 RepID=UPI001052E090|nr:MULTISPECIES: hypothetical protein [unclassified Sphingomonas]MDY0968687.1 hypothetical protein [Sphingomonas sp. CFBP9021]TCQ01472.1 hypothetical protein C8J46_101840 [Sphingomonas sp. PP-F2F-A104-K0414]